MTRPYCVIIYTAFVLFFGGTVLHASSMSKSPMWNETWTDRLKQDLFVKYDKFVRPSQLNTTVVNFDVRIIYIYVNEFKSSVTINAIASHTWTDEKLRWDPSKYGNIQHIHVGNHEVWLPDIALYQSGTANTIKHYGDTICIVFHDGTVIWVPPAQFVGLCELDFHLWPFDTQICNMGFGSLAYDGDQIDIRLRESQIRDLDLDNLSNGTSRNLDGVAKNKMIIFSPKFKLFRNRKSRLHQNDEKMQQDLYMKNAEWKLMDLKKTRSIITYACCPEPYVNLNFQMTLKRNSAVYCSILLMPAAAIVCLVLVTFWLPPQSEMKISIAACTILTISVFLAFFSFKLPLTTNLPLIVYFFSGCLCLVTISLVLSILVINIAKRTFCKPLPRNIRLCLLSWPGKLLGLSDLISVIESRRSIPSQELRGKLTEESAIYSMSNISDDGDRQNMISPMNITQSEWILAGTVVDRVAFVLFCLILVTMAIVCIS